MKVAHPKTKIRRTFARMSFDFMTGIVLVELRFGQQVAAEALKNIPKPLFLRRSRDGSIGAGLLLSRKIES
jgi:hypothetical protein